MRTLWGVTAALLLAATAFADQATRTIHDVATIENGSGQARILFRIGDLSDLGPIIIQRAQLRVPISGEAVARSLDVRVHNLTTDWNAGSVNWTSGWTRAGGDFEYGMYGARLVDLSRGATTAVLDVSSLLKDTYEMEVPSRGVILTADTNYTDGLDASDLSRFANLGSAVVEVEYVRVSRTPASLLAEGVRGR